MPGLSLEQAQALGFKPARAASGGLTLEQAQALGFHAADTETMPSQPSLLDKLKSFGSGLIRTALPSTTLADYYEGPKYVLLHPLEAAKLTASSIGAAQKEQFSKAMASAQKGDVSEAGGHALAAALPLIGPAAAAAGENIGAGNVAEGLGQATGISLPFLLPWASGLKKGGEVLEKSAAKNYLSTLQVTSKKLVPQAEQVAAGLAEEKPINFGLGGFIKRAQAEKEAVGPAADIAYNSKPAVNPQQIFQDLEDLRQRKAIARGTNVVTSEPLNAAIDDLKTKLMAMQDELGNVPAATLDDFRDKLFRGLVDATGNYRDKLAPQTVKSIEQGTARSIKRLLDNNFADAQTVNDSYHLWAKAYDFLEDARRKNITSKAAVTSGSSKGFGALLERSLPRPVRAFPKYTLGFFDLVAWNTVNGAAKQTVADTIAQGNWAKLNLIMGGLAARNSIASEGQGSVP